MAICSQHGRRIPRGTNAEFLLGVGTFCETNAGIRYFSAVLLHLQILQEEKYLPVAFGEEYISYKKNMCADTWEGKEKLRWTDGDRKMY